MKNKGACGGANALEGIGLLAAARHADDLRVTGAAVPECEQDEICRAQPQLRRAACPVIEDVLVKQLVKAVNGNAEHAGSLVFSVIIGISSICVNHHIRPRGQLALYLFLQLGNIG